MIERKMLDIMALLEEFIRFRFVEKVSRPISNTERQTFIEHYKALVDSLHDKMDKLKLDQQK